MTAASRGLLALGASFSRRSSWRVSRLSGGRTDIRPLTARFARLLADGARGGGALAAYAGWIVSVEPGISRIGLSRRLAATGRVSGRARGGGDYNPSFCFGLRPADRSSSRPAGTPAPGTLSFFRRRPRRRLARRRLPRSASVRDRLAGVGCEPFQPMQFYRLALDEPSARRRQPASCSLRFPGPGRSPATEASSRSRPPAALPNVSVHDLSTGNSWLRRRCRRRSLRMVFPTRDHLRLAEESSGPGSVNEVSRQLGVLTRHRSPS